MSAEFSSRCDSHRAVESQKIATGLKFRVLEVQGLYYVTNNMFSHDAAQSIPNAFSLTDFKYENANILYKTIGKASLDS